MSPTYGKAVRGRARRAACAAALCQSAAALAGGTPENALILIDPARTDAQYVGNYYRSVRNVPAENILYIDPAAVSFQVWAGHHREALFGHIANRRIEDHIDYIVIAPARFYRIAAPGLVEDSCADVNRFSISGVYTMAFIADEVLAGMESTDAQGYWRPANGARGFDSNIYWWNGIPRDESVPQARRSFIGCSLGWTGVNGNTVEEIIDMIDRSAPVDGTFPDGTFYLMETTDPARSGPRAPAFDDVVAAIEDLDGQAEHLFAVLPAGRHDCLGVMTGWATPDIDGTDMTLLPGSICDHLTSYAATFDDASQVKMSRWIAKGASGTWGAIEEPCNYSGKFPHAREYFHYFKGLSLGEAIFRSVEYVPFQGLMIGDPLTRPFAHIPVVSVPDAPVGPVSGVITLTPSATTTDEDAAIAGFELLVDGVLTASVGVGGQFMLDTAALGDGYHDIRVLAADDSLVKSVGRWVGSIDVDNHGRSASVLCAPLSGDWNTAFDLDVSAIGVGATEIRVLQNGRVVAAGSGASASLTVHGLTFGAGPVQVQAEALFADGSAVRSAPIDIDVDYSGATPSGSAPIAYSYTRRIRPDSPTLVELPATYDDATATLTYSMIQNPAQAQVAGELIGAYRLLRPNAGADGVDTMQFRVDSPTGSSAVATVTLIYSPCAGDIDEDGDVTLADLSALLTNFGAVSGATRADGDFDGDGDVDLADLSELLERFGSGCP